jgi:hypothetical protein
MTSYKGKRRASGVFFANSSAKLDPERISEPRY